MTFHNLRMVVILVVVLAGGLLFGSAAWASPIGTLNVGSTGDVTLSLSSVIFNVDPAAVGGGNSDVANGTNLSFTGCASAVLGSPGCLSASEGITVNNADLTLTAPSAANANTFLTFAAHPSLVYSMVWPAGPGSSNTNCATANSNGLSCSIFAGSPLILTYANGDTFIGLGVHGNASDAGVAGLATGSTYTGGFSDFFTATLPNNTAPTPQNIQLYFCPGGTCVAADFTSGKSITTSVAGTFTANATQTPVPEPLSLSLLGSGLLGLRLFRRRSVQ